MADRARARTTALTRAAFLAGAYWCAGRLALLMAIPPGYATAVWPAAGVAMVGLLRWGPRVAPAVFVGSFLVNVGTSFDTSTSITILRSVAIAAAIAAGATLQASLARALIVRGVTSTSLEDEPDIRRFSLLGGPVACTVNATIGVATLFAAGLVTTDGLAFSWFTWWVGDTIGVLVFSPVLLALVGEPRQRWRGRRLFVVAPAVAGFVAVTVLFVRVSAWDQHRVEDEFERRSAPLGYALDRAVARHDDVLLSIASLFAASQEVTADEFARFVAVALARHEGILRLAWCPYVTDGDRDQFEADARARDLAGFEIREPAPTGGLRPAGRRRDYAVSLFVEPSGDADRARGYDLASEPVRREALTRARATGAPAATAPLDLLAGAGTGFLVAMPVVRGDQLRGYVVGVFQMDVVIDAALRELDRDGLDVVVRDVTGPGPATPMYGRGSSSPPWNHDREVGGRRWRLEVRPTAAMVARTRSWQAWFVLAGGLLFIGLLEIVALVTTGRAARIEAEAARAVEAEAKYRDLYEHAPDMHAVVDLATGVVLDCNLTLAATLGLPKHEVMGRPVAELHEPASADDLAQALRVLAATGAVAETSLALRSRTGGPIEVSLGATVARDGSGHLLGRTVWRDVTQRRNAERDQRLLLELTELARGSRNPDELQATISVRLGQHLQVSRCILHEIDLAGDRGTIVVDYADGVPSLAGQTYQLSGFSPHTQAELRAGHVVINDDARTDPRTADAYPRSYLPLDIAAYVVVPLLRDGVWQASLWVVSRTPRRWDPREVALIHTVAEKAWLWLEHVRLDAAVHVLNAELEQRVDERTADLRVALRERDSLVREIHHRVKNNLQVISSLLSLQAKHVTDQTARGLLEESRARVHAIAMVHERLYRAPDLARIELGEYVRSLVANLLYAHDASDRRITAEIEIDAVQLEVSVAIPCGLIIGELVTNSLRHGFEGRAAGVIHVRLRQAEGIVELGVSDDGVGLPPGLNPRNSPSLGLELVMTFADQLQAAVVVGRDPGTSFSFRFDPVDHASA